MLMPTKAIATVRSAMGGALFLDKACALIAVVSFLVTPKCLLQLLPRPQFQVSSLLVAVAMRFEFCLSY
jgi:hypothetical protein